MKISFEELLEKGGVILSLERYAHRFQHTRLRLEEVGFKNLTMLKGVDGFEDDLGAAAARAGFTGVYDQEIAARPGNIACTLSHLSAWKKVIDEGLPYLLIFEDDALPHPKFHDLAAAWWDQTRRDIDMVLLGNQMDLAVAASASANLVLSSPAFCLHAYIVTQKGARRLLELVAKQPTMKMNDIQVMEWMTYGLLQYDCWNGTSIQDKGYPIFTQHTPLTDVVHKQDMIVERRDTGLIYQNFCLGHTLAGKNQIYNIVMYE